MVFVCNIIKMNIYAKITWKNFFPSDLRMLHHWVVKACLQEKSLFLRILNCLHNLDLIIALFDTGAMCSCISYQLFTKIADKVDIIRKTLRANTASGTTLGPIGIVHFIMNKEEHSFEQNYMYKIETTFDDRTWLCPKI